MNHPLLDRRLSVEGLHHAATLMATLCGEKSAFLPPSSQFGAVVDTVVRNWVKYGNSPTFTQFIGSLSAEERFIFFVDRTVRCALSKKEVDKLVSSKDWTSLTRAVWRRADALK